MKCVGPRNIAAAGEKVSSSGDVQRRCTDGDAMLDADMKQSDKYRKEAKVMMSTVWSSSRWLVRREREEKGRARVGTYRCLWSSGLGGRGLV